jgi:hypothetical protein
MIKEAVGLGVRYLCKCGDYKDPIQYKGSGVFWRKIINKHNCEIKTTILGFYSTKEALREAGEYYSNYFNVVQDRSWANLIPEIGDGGRTTNGKFKCYNPSTLQERLVSCDEDIPTGWIKGGSPSNTKGKVRYHNPDTNEVRMFSKEDVIPIGWKKGGLKGIYSYGPRKDETKVYHNGERKIYIKEGDPVPDGFIQGVHYQGTTKNRIAWYNPITREKKYLKSGDPIPVGYIRGLPPTTGKPIKTPYGNFDNVQKAMDSLGMTRHTIYNNINKNPKEWSFISDQMDQHKDL